MITCYLEAVRRKNYSNERSTAFSYALRTSDCNYKPSSYDIEFPTIQFKSLAAVRKKRRSCLQIHQIFPQH